MRGSVAASNVSRDGDIGRRAKGAPTPPVCLGPGAPALNSDDDGRHRRRSTAPPCDASTINYDGAAIAELSSC